MKGYVYLIKLNDFDIVKIGFTDNLQRRLIQIKLGLPFECSIIKYKEYLSEYTARMNEKYLHKKYKDCKVVNCRGNEWFTLSQDKINEIISYIDDTELIIEKPEKHIKKIYKKRKNKLQETIKVEFSLKTILKNIKK